LRTNELRNLTLGRLKKMRCREPWIGVEIEISVVAILENVPNEFLSGKDVGGS